jgi:flagellar basal body-associated protein FliL
MITLPSGETVPIFVPPGVSSGQVIPVERPGMPTVLVTVNTSSMIPPPPPPLERTQLAQPQGATPQFGQMPVGQNPGPISQAGQTPMGQSQGAMPPQFDRTQLAQQQGVAPQMQFGQSQWGQPPVGQPPMGQSQGPQPRPKSNLTRIIVLAVIALLVIIAAVVGIFAFTTNQHNQQVAATGTASSQTQVAQNNATATQSAANANATATQGVVNATATAANTFPAVAGNYLGTLTNTANAGKQFTMALALQQNQQSITGTCSLDTSPFAIQNGTITLSGQLTFSITIPASGSSSATTLNFTGSQQSNGGLSGTWTSTTGGQGPWTTTKS